MWKILYLLIIKLIMVSSKENTLWRLIFCEIIYPCSEYLIGKINNILQYNKTEYCISFQIIRANALKCLLTLTGQLGVGKAKQLSVAALTAKMHKIIQKFHGNMWTNLFNYFLNLDGEICCISSLFSLLNYL